MKLFRNLFINAVVVLVLSLGLFSCGSSSDSAGTPAVDDSPVTKTGVFVDSPIGGGHFETETRSGETNAAGEFEYIEGETVTFSIGDIVFPPVTAKGTVTPLDLAGSTDVNNQVVINVIRLLQTLDSDGNPDNGITITVEVRNTAAGVSIDFNLSSDTEFEAAVSTFLAGAPRNPTLVSTEDAQAHFEDSLFQQMSGNYSGTFSGDGSGTWRVTIDASGNITGTVKDDSDPEGSSPDSISGRVLSDGSTTIGVVGGNGSFSGTITLTGDISGTWESTDPVESGTFIGKKDSPLLTFNAATVPGVYQVIASDFPGEINVYTFNTNGTGVADWADDPVDENFTWSVDAEGRLVVNLADATGLDDRYTLLSGTVDSGVISAEIDEEPEDGVYDPETIFASFTRISAGSGGSGGSAGTPALAFNAATVPGVYQVIASDFPGEINVYTFNTNGTGVADWADDPVDENFTWSVDAKGRLVVNLADATGLDDRYTLLSGTVDSGVISAEIDDEPEDGVYDAGTVTASFVRQ